MNIVELNAVLYYADFLSMKERSYPVTDNCKYFFIHGIPMNSTFILDLSPVYDESDIYFLQALAEYLMIRDKFGDEGVESFIDDICSIKACGTVDGERMLLCIHQFSSKKLRNQAFNTYQNWKNNQVYTYKTTDENGKLVEKPCTKYVYHAKRLLGEL